MSIERCDLGRAHFEVEESIMRYHLLIAASSLALIMPGPASAGESKIDLTTWDQSLVHRGWRATEFFDTKVYGEGGEQIGAVEDFHVDMDGNVTRVIVESGGVFDIGDVHLAVPCDQVLMWPGEHGIVVPVRDENIPDFSLFREDPELAVAVFPATDLVGDLVYLADGDQYGVVEDLIVDWDGRLQAVVVSPDVGFTDRNRKAYPWYGAGYDPVRDRYHLPYYRREIELLGPFDYDTVEN
jgi:sporulation protein YlmC with PRC-barrel domain